MDKNRIAYFFGFLVERHQFRSSNLVPIFGMINQNCILFYLAISFNPWEWEHFSWDVLPTCGELFFVAIFASRPIMGIYRRF